MTTAEPRESEFIKMFKANLSRNTVGGGEIVNYGENDR